jgi:predicted DNA-binding protein
MENNKMAAIYMPKELIKRLKILAAENETSMSEFVRQAITEKLENMNVDSKKEE